MPKYLAFDIGTSAGRAMVGTLDADGFALEELHRFANRSVCVRGTLYWDILYLWHELLSGLKSGKLSMNGHPGASAWIPGPSILRCWTKAAACWTTRFITAIGAPMEC
jgi:hypothetical protein